MDSSLTVSALGKGSLMVLIAQGLQSIRGIVLLPFITRLLSAGDYGLWVQAGTLTSLLSPIATLYLGSAILRFFAAESEPRRVARALIAVFVTIAVLSLLVALAVILTSGTIAAAFFEGQSAILPLAMASLLPECLGSICLAYFRTFRQMGRFSFFSVARPYVELVTLIILLLTGHTLIQLIFAMAIVRAALTGVMMAIILRETGWATPDFSPLPQYLRFSVPLMPTNLMLWVTNASDRFVIGYYLGVAAVGFYNPGYALGTVVAFMSAPILYVLPTFVYAHFDQGRTKLATEYLSRALLTVVVTGLLMTAVLGGLSLPILSLLATTEMAQRGYLVTPFVALGATAQICTIVVSLALACVKKTHLMAYSAFAGACLNLGLNIIFIPRYGIVAAAVTTLVAMLVDLGIRLALARRHVQLTIPWCRLIRAAVAASILGISLFAVSPSAVASLLGLVIVSPVVYLALLLGLRVVNLNDIREGGKFVRGLINVDTKTSV
jgi:O-antigen/teichoic acid export membrane protein